MRTAVPPAAAALVPSETISAVPSTSLTLPTAASSAAWAAPSETKSTRMAGKRDLRQKIDRKIGTSALACTGPGKGEGATLTLGVEIVNLASGRRRAMASRQAGVRLIGSGSFTGSAGRSQTHERPA